MPQHLRLFASPAQPMRRPVIRVARLIQPRLPRFPHMQTVWARTVFAACAFAALLFSPALHAQLPSTAVAHAHRSALRPFVQGTDGTQTGTASFFGNATTITTPSGALSVFRRPNCSLTLATGTYTINPFAYTQTELAPNYEQVLHAEAQLKTTPDVFANGCAIQPTAGFGSETGIFVGTTTTGVNVFAGLGLTPSFVNGVYILSGVNTFSLSSFQFSSAGNLTAADLNKDGNGDLVILDNPIASTARVTVMLGNADGTFQTAVSYPIAGNYSVAAVIDDINNDGNLDIVAVSGDQQISVLLGNGNGTFQAAQSFAAPALPGYSSAASTPIGNLITADVNHDGNKDIVANNGLVLLGDGKGNFTATAAPAFPYAQDNLYSAGPDIASGDLNNDGKVDLVVNNSSSISIWLGKGDGSFTQGPSYATINTDGYIAVTDLDGDGNADILVGLGDGGAFGGDEGSPGLAYALMGNGNGTFQGAPLVNSGGAYNGKNLADVNGDTIPDLITLNTASNALVVELGNGTGNFAQQTGSVAIPSTLTLDGDTIGTSSATIIDYTVGDLNGDGKPDLVFVVGGLTFNGGSEFGSPVFFTALNNGNGTFATPVVHEFSTLIPPGANNQAPTVTGVRIGNFVKNGHSDVLFSFTTPGTYIANGSLNQGFVVYPGDGAGNFGTAAITYTYQSTTTPTILQTPMAAAVADLNDDKVSDILAVVPTGIVNAMLQTSLEEFIANGDGTFAAPTTINCAPNPYLIEPPDNGAPFVLTDFNKDGNPDLACVGETSAGQGELAIALGNGTGAFGAPTVLNIAGGDTARNAQLAAADFDGDGNTDLALFDPAAYSGIFYGDGNGGFSSVNSSGTAIPKDLINISSQDLAGIAAVAADVNNDGKPDILYSNTIYLNSYGTGAVTLPSSNTALSASPTTATVGTSITFTATVTGQSGSTGTPTGTVTFMDGPTTLSTVTLASGNASYSTSALAIGLHDVTAIYSGDASFAGSTSQEVTVTINAATPINTTTTLTGSPTSGTVGTTITFSATVTPVSGGGIPTGTVVFMDGASAIGVINLDANGKALLITSSLMAGAHSITAQYSGSGSYNTSTSSAISVTITAPPVDFTLTSSGSSGSVTAANPTNTDTLTVTPVNGFDATISFACAGLPSDVTCSFYPVTLTPGGGQTATTTVTFTEGASAQLDHAGSRGTLLACFGLGSLLLVGIRRRRGIVRTLTILVAASVLAGILSCGGGSKGHTLSNSTVTITATSGMLSHNVTYTLTSE